MSIPWLERDDHRFPPTHTALTDPNGLLAAGGDLSPTRLLNAYRHGIFPWYSEGQPLLWWSPDPRLVLFPDLIHISKSLRKLLKKNRLAVTFDSDFGAVIDACSAPREIDSPGTWITPEMNLAYRHLHRNGFAHSVEVWDHNHLVGGLYGISLGRIFFGESMFSLAANASKIALVYLCGQLQQWDFKLIDCQVESDHLLSMGATNISRQEFEQHLREYTNIRAEGLENCPAARPGKWPLTWKYS